nr:uncharacterized protein LOC117220017 isoform X3 [Megalopta genalis]
MQFELHGYSAFGGVHVFRVHFERSKLFVARSESPPSSSELLLDSPTLGDGETNENVEGPVSGNRRTFSKTGNFRVSGERHRCSRSIEKCSRCIRIAASDLAASRYPVSGFARPCSPSVTYRRQAKTTDRRAGGPAGGFRAIIEYLPRFHSTCLLRTSIASVNPSPGLSADRDFSIVRPARLARRGMMLLAGTEGRVVPVDRYQTLLSACPTINRLPAQGVTVEESTCQANDRRTIDPE